MWFGNGVWNVHLYNPDHTAVQFTLQVTSSSLKAYPTSLESPFDVVKASTALVTSTSSSAYDIDALRIVSPCSRTANVCRRERSAMAASQIFLAHRARIPGRPGSR